LAQAGFRALVLEPLPLMPDGEEPRVSRTVFGTRCTGVSWLDFRSAEAGWASAAEDAAGQPSFRCFGTRAPAVLDGAAEAPALEPTMGMYACVGSLDFFEEEPYLARCSGLSVEVLRKSATPQDAQEAWQPTPLWNLYRQAEEFASRGPEAIPVVARAVGGRIQEIGERSVLVGKAFAQEDFPTRTKDRAVEICNTASRILTRVRTAVDVKSWASESEGS